MTVLEELGALHLSRPGVGASAAEVAAWHERRAVMLEHAAGRGELDSTQAIAWAAAAHRRGQVTCSGSPERTAA